MINIKHNTLEVLVTNFCILKPISLKHVSHRYLAWLNDPDINKFLETRFNEINIAILRDYVASQIKKGDNLFYAIHSLSDTHIGNIKLGPINPNHMTADIGFFIGDKSYHRKGIASHAIIKLCEYGFSMGIKKITAGAYSSNLGSIKTLLKSGFNEEGFRRSQVISDGKREGVSLFGLTS
jgi:[ribosomal protein S5]-alanine N-acetyltransferase